MPQPGEFRVCVFTLVAATSPNNDGAADQSRATAPAKCGAAMEVPLFDW